MRCVRWVASLDRKRCFYEQQAFCDVSCKPEACVVVTRPTSHHDPLLSLSVSVSFSFLNRQNTVRSWRLMVVGNCRRIKGSPSSTCLSLYDSWHLFTTLSDPEFQLSNFPAKIIFLGLFKWLFELSILNLLHYWAFAVRVNTIIHILHFARLQLEWTQKVGGENRRMQNLVLNRVMLFVTLFGLVKDLI